MNRPNENILTSKKNYIHTEQQNSDKQDFFITSVSKFSKDHCVRSPQSLFILTIGRVFLFLFHFRHRTNLISYSINNEINNRVKHKRFAMDGLQRYLPLRHLLSLM